ncbi:hypothetical protein [Shewanella surugensis]|uniref:Uncharacterized protein n=1 Tax=Shewanella surugensis TaxID=212020 RepID=A0ABT0L740_9GAMM|nr:hypothetical protein [Shewanella surugensis]MCL1123503.1 hypothetical protein [Shewanella surugensis]
MSLLSSQDDTFKEDIEFIEGWQACACEDSVGYTLVKGFREAILARLSFTDRR